MVLEHSETPERFVAAIGAAATGVSVVTTAGPAGRFGLTVSAIASVSAEPPLLLACVNRKSPAVVAVDANGRFAVNILAETQQEVAEVFSGRPRDGMPYDFTRHGWEQGTHGLPLLVGAASTFECAIDQATDAGTHRIYIGRVYSAIRNGVPPLIYSNRSYSRLTPL